MISDPHRPSASTMVQGCVLGVLAFLAELVLFAATALAGWRGGWRIWGSTVPAAACAVVTVVVLIVIWARFFAPRAPVRVTNPTRAICIGALAVAVAGLLWLLSGPMWGIALLGVAAVLVITQLVMGEQQPPPRGG